MFLLLLPPAEATLAAAGEGPASWLALVTVTADELPPPAVPVIPPDEDVFIPLLSLLPPFTGDDAEKKKLAFGRCTTKAAGFILRAVVTPTCSGCSRRRPTIVQT